VLIACSHPPAAAAAAAQRHPEEVKRRGRSPATTPIKISQIPLTFEDIAKPECS